MRWWSVLGRAVVTLGLLAGCAGGGQPDQSMPASSSSERSTATTTTPSTSPSRTLDPGSVTPSPSQPSVGHDAWVAVSVATVWRSPQAPRPVDAAALANPAAIRKWLSGLSTTERRGLIGLADTQALLGDRVRLTAVRGAFAKVVVPDQPTPLDPRGYPGWVPLAQLTASAPPPATTVATVVSRTAWLRDDDATGDRAVEVSFGTRLPVLGTTDALVRVGLPGGRVLRASARQVSVTESGDPALPPDGAALVRSATMFTGLPYLWAGRSGFGVDCSGLTSLVYRVHGVVIPRDAAPQADAGTAAARDALHAGDLLFYAHRGKVHHVTMYAGGGRMVHAPSTGRTVEVIAVSTASFASELSGARRFVR